MKTQNCSRLIVLALCASLAPAAVAQVSGAAPATIFEHTNFGGKSQALVEGMNVGPLALGNDVASSVKVSKCFKVTLYGAGPGQNGPELVLTADDANLMDDNFNDILSNVLVERVPNCNDAGPATAQGFKDGVTAVTIQNPSNPDPTVHLLVKRGKNKNGDGIFTIQKSLEEKVSLNYENGKLGWGAPTQWVLHKNSTGWSVMLASDEALAVSIANGEMVLQRNQGAPHQLWQIEEK